MFERDVNQAFALRYPSAYKIGQEGRLFTFSAFWKEIGLALWHGAVCFYIPMRGLGGAYPASSDGLLNEHWYYSTMSFALILHLVTYKLFVDSYFWNLFSLAAGVLGIALFYIFSLIASTPAVANLIQPQLNGLMYEIL
jgi:phospholipid-translocating ATPase